MKIRLVFLLTALIALNLFAAGKQLTGQHAPAASPALSPAEAQKRFSVPPGFEVRLFAAEPDVINPVAMTWDERGRLWVVELYEYPLGAPKGTKPRDRIIILEDTDGDGRADKRTIFADGLNLATGILLGNGGVYVGQAPEILFLQDTNAPLLAGAGAFEKANKRTVLLNGFGLEDRHELLNGFTWGPDGWLYLTHGVFTHSSVKIPEATEPGVTVNAAVARFHPRTKKFEVFADGTSNPWGVDFDRTGNAFVSACVVDHFWHMAPGGIYVRQGGIPGNPYAYELLPSIVDHRHHMAAYSGVNIYQGNQFPAAWLGLAFMGNIHQSAVNCDRLTPNGSSFKATAEKDFLVANDGWFRPVSEQTGPDGALWIADWYDKYPCYQNARADPEGVDRERGRIWRVVWTGQEPRKKVASRPDVKMDLAKLSSRDLVKLLAHPNIWQRRTAQRILNERRDDTVQGELQKLFAGGATLDARLAAFWTLYTSGYLADDILAKAALDPEPAVRAWAARLTGEQRLPNHVTEQRLEKLGGDPDPTVRLATAVACRQFTSDALTVDQPVPADFATKLRPGESLEQITIASRDGTDPLLPFMIWMASEPLIAQDHAPALKWMLANGQTTHPLSERLLRKVVRRICDHGDPRKLDDVVEFLSDICARDTALALATLDGLLDGQKGKALAPAKSTDALMEKLRASSEAGIRDRAQQLGALWGDAGAIAKTLALIGDAKAALPARLKAVESVRGQKTEAVRGALLAALAPGNPEPLVLESIRALGQIGGDEVGTEFLARWKIFSPAVRRATAEILASRGRWASALLSALEQQKVSRDDIPATAIRALTSSKDDYGMLARRAGAVFGKVRDADKDKLKLIAAKKKMILGAKAAPDLAKGHELAKTICFTCHKLHGEGADIGPDLTGVGRSTLDALLANVIDPNQIVGAGYELVEVETRDGRTVSGRMVENNDARVRLLSAGPKEDILAKSDIADLRISQLSLMPEGLEQMPDDDFRNLIAFILNPPPDGAPFSWKNEETPAPKPALKAAAKK
ncbi:MAG: c-type cytochrome [Verrucomicrobia bacterium]|nr:c-type cytochrome [Verrucomicrobiota bacterium]